MDQTSQPERRRRGRPALPKEAHRRRLTVRFHPALLRHLEAAAAKAGRSLTQEIEERCEAHEILIAMVATEFEKISGQRVVPEFGGVIPQEHPHGGTTNMVVIRLGDGVYLNKTRKGDTP